MKEVKIINDSYNFIKWMLPVVARFPRNYRFSLGHRFETGMYDFLELIQRGYYSADKIEHLKSADMKLEHIRLLIRLSYELHLFDSKIHHAILEQLESIGRQLGGWIKSLEKPQ